MIKIPRLPYGLNFKDAARRHFGLVFRHDLELFDDTIQSQMTIGGVRITVHQPEHQPAQAPATSHVEVAFPRTAATVFTGSTAIVEQFAVWVATDIIATEERINPRRAYQRHLRSVPLRLPVIDPDALTTTGLIAVAADDETTWTGDRWWCLFDNGEQLTRTAGDLHMMLREAALSIDVFYGARRDGRHRDLLHTASQHTIATVFYTSTLSTLDQHLATTQPASVPAFQAVRSITGWTPAQLSAALDRHHNLIPRLIDTLHNQPD